MELQHDQGYSGDRDRGGGGTKCLPTVGIYGEVQERIGGGKPHSGTNERLNKDS